MRKSEKIAAVPAEAGAQTTPWPELSQRWQAAGMEWANWWSRAMSGGSSGLAPPGAVTQALAFPAMPVAWVPPEALAAINARYQQKFEALWSRVLGADGVAPAVQADGDRRFAAKAWREQPYFAFIKDAYLLYSDYVRELTDLAQADPDAKKRLAFVANQYISAIAPSNFLATNPDALQLALSSQGASIAQGASNLIADAQRGRIAMTDEAAFEVGRNLAVTPGSVVFENEADRANQYAPAAPTVFKRPLLIVPPCINKYYILDLRPENSFVRYAVEQGHTVFMISWRNIPAELGHLTWDDYLERGVLTAIDCARDRIEQDHQFAWILRRRNLLACALAVLTARRTPHVASATLLTTMLDFADQAISASISPAIRLPPRGRAPCQRPDPRQRLASVFEPQAKRAGVELRGWQLPQGPDSSGFRFALLERRLRQPSRSHVSFIRARYVSRQPAAGAAGAGHVRPDGRSLAHLDTHLSPGNARRSHRPVAIGVQDHRAAGRRP
jgi:predicted outer membrane lipoprotein